MTDYTEITIHCSEETSEILIAELYNQGYEGFWETENGFKAYIIKNKFEPQSLNSIISRHIQNGEPVTFTLENIPAQNWNEEWEKNFEPVIIADKFLIKAPFHFVDDIGLTSFTISPKMAFGTGHHSTTQLMIEMMLSTDLTDKKLLDFGTGTGILSIIAEYSGAKEIIAIDNSNEAIDCAIENIQINNCKKIKVSFAEIDQLNFETFDIIIANINRNILTENVLFLSKMLKKGDKLLISGFYENDIQYISSIFEKENLCFKSSKSKNSWVACQYIKS
jgi:ribosomal protein L11 methyltransferase